MFVFKSSTSLTDHYTSTIKRGLLGKCSQQIDPTLPYYEPSFVLLSQPAISFSNRGSSHPAVQTKAANSVKNQGLSFYLIWKILVNWFVFLLFTIAVLISLVYFGPRVNQALSESFSSNPLTNVGSWLGLRPAKEPNSLNEVSRWMEEYDQHLRGDYQDDRIEPKEAEDPARYLPEQDPSLPEEDLIIIEKIGVNTQLQRTEDEDEALDTGAWWVPDFGIPGDLQLPMIVSAHRYGWEWWWKSDYWQLHSFYKLPHLQPGDKVEIISEQRRFIYEIYDGVEGEQISDYDADLILYTCKHLNSPIRYFRYARLVRDN